MSIKKNIFLLIFPFLILCVLSACYLKEDKIIISDAKTAVGVDEKLVPILVTEVFPEGTSRVFCWFQWKEAKVGTQVTAKWHYVTDDIHVLDYTFNIPRKQASGSISLAMPDDKKLPVGTYRVDLTLGNRILKSLSFRIGEK
jgi:hypothetical protein